MVAVDDCRVRKAAQAVPPMDACDVDDAEVAAEEVEAVAVGGADRPHDIVRK